MSVNIIKEFKYILSGCNTILDALYFLDLYIKDKSESDRSLLLSIVYGTTYDNVLDMINIKDLLNNISLIQIDNFSKINLCMNDQFYVKIFKRLSMIINNKSYKMLKKCKYIRKSCPNCSFKYIGNGLTTYVICGLEDEKNGFNWDGCGKDWCFKCEKKLCKSWTNDKLFLSINRYHDANCCRMYAELNNEDYNNYCKCKNIYVNRLNNHI